jgi:3-hydroxy-9,10-secoandrosta-1,3,5(10)-triene-9,17-dione monooxygenase reductase component
MDEKEVALGSDAYRDVMGHFCTGVVVISALNEGVPVGMTCQSFVSLSLSPPLILFCPSRNSTSWPKIKDAGRFCVNVLEQGQREIGERFAVSGGDKFSGIAWSTSDLGNPTIEDCLAHVECSIDQVYGAGDHDIVVGNVVDLRLVRPGQPLLFYRGIYANLSA